jgi:hypothetical protein
MKKIEVQMLLHIDKKFHGSWKIHVKSIWSHNVLQNDEVVWWPRHWCGTKETKVQFPLPTYILYGVCIFVYIPCTCV